MTLYTSLNAPKFITTSAVIILLTFMSSSLVSDSVVILLEIVKKINTMFNYLKKDNIKEYTCVNQDYVNTALHFHVEN